MIDFVVRRISLTETRIAYGNVDGPPKDFVPITSNTTGEAISIDGKDFVFKISSGSDELILQAESEEERRQWLAAVKRAANPPPPASTGNAEADKLAAELEKSRLEAGRHATEIAAHAHSGLVADVIHGVENLEHKAAAEAEKLRLAAEKVEAEARAAAAEAAAKLAAEKAAAEKVAAAAAAAAKRQLYNSVSGPVACNKKLSNETAYHPRFIWIKEDSKEFCWSKASGDAKYKTISIPGNVKSIRSNADVASPNFTIELQNAESVFSGGLFSSVPSSIDVTMDDALLISAFLAVISELKA